MKKILLRISLVCMMLISFSSTTLAADWQWIVSTDKTTYSFDKAALEEFHPGVYRSWIKTDYVDSAGKELSKELNLSEPVVYMLTYSEFDSRKNTMKDLKAYLYGKNDRVIKKYSNTPTHSIISDTIGSEIFRVTYAEYKKQFNK